MRGKARKQPGRQGIPAQAPVCMANQDDRQSTANFQRLPHPEAGPLTRPGLQGTIFVEHCALFLAVAQEGRNVVIVRINHPLEFSLG